MNEFFPAHRRLFKRHRRQSVLVTEVNATASAFWNDKLRRTAIGKGDGNDRCRHRAVIRLDEVVGRAFQPIALFDGFAGGGYSGLSIAGAGEQSNKDKQI